MILAVVAIELIVSLSLALLIAVGNADGEQAKLFINIWLVLAVLQLAIHYLPRDRHTRYGLLLLVILMLLVGVTPGKIEALTYFHQPLFIAGIAALPQLWLEQFSKGPKGRASVLGLTTLVSLPLGFAAWSLANIWIVKVEAWSASNGGSYCIFVSDGKIFRSGYHQAANDWNLSGWRMISGRGAGGSGDCCQWDFHALLLTHDNRLFNWSYKSQRFENAERTRTSMGLNRLSCK